MRITDVLLGNLLLEYKETKVRGILNNKNLMDALQKRAESGGDHQAKNLITRQEQDPEDKLVHPAENILRSLAEADPTDNSIYLNWILNRYKDGQFMLEDISRIKADLADFDRLKGQLPQKDINAYKSVTDLRKALSDADQEGEVRSARQEKKEIVDRIKRQEIDVIMDEGNFLVVSPKTPEASNYLGWWTGYTKQSGLEWCTLNRKPLPNYAPDDWNQTDSYNSRGTLYQIIVNHGSPNVRSFQIHYEDGQFMNEQNQPIDQDDIEMLSEIPAYKKFLELLVNKYYSQYFTDSE